MDLGYTVGSEYRLLGGVPERFAFAELAVGEGDLPLSRLDANAVGSHLPDDVALTVHLPFRQPMATGVPELDRAVRDYVARAIEVADLAAAADASLCFDVGHAHMETDEETIAAFVYEAGDLIDYLHVHDIRARGDSHVPVGAGEIDFAWLGGLLREIGFDGRAAVEVFTDDAAHVLDSADRFAAAVGGETRR